MLKLLASFPVLLLFMISCTNNENKYIRIYSEESSEVPVSYAIIKAGISITGKDVAKLDSSSHNKILKALFVIGKYGIKEISTANSSIGTEYDNKEFFESNQTYNLKVYNINKIDALRAELTNIGFNQFDIISYGSDSLQKYQKDLYKKAIKSAQEKANELALSSGIKIGKICKVVDSRVTDENDVDNFSNIASAELFGKGGFAEGIDGVLKYANVKPTILKKTFTINVSFTIYFDIKE